MSALAVIPVLSALCAAEAEIPEGLAPEAYRVVRLNEPQMFVDDYLVENRYNEEFISARVGHVLMQPKRLPEPVLTGNPDWPWDSRGIGYPSVVYDAEASRFRLYYQVWNANKGEPGYPSQRYIICYAESADGVHWEKPLMDIHPWGTHERTNIVILGESEAHVPHVLVADAPRGGRIQNLGAVPADCLRGHRFVMYYGDAKHYLATSEDGIHWQERQEMILDHRIDCYHTIVYDEARKEFVTFFRNRRIFEAPKGDPKKGNTRMMARLSSPELWALWGAMPTTVLLPDRDDAGRFYGMPTFLYGGVYWGMLLQFAETPQSIEVELVHSRDGFEWHHVPGRPRIIPIGQEGAWDDGMTFSGDRVIEHGNEWWLYYSAYDGFHDVRDRQAGLGLLKFGKERLVAIQADERGQMSTVVTRPLLWPGGDLLVNADVARGEMRVQVTDIYREPLEGYGYEACEPLKGDAMRQKVAWQAAASRDLAGRLIRLEFQFKNGYLFAFVASDEPEAEESS